MLRIITAHRPPLVFVDGGNGSEAIFSGYLIDLLPALLHQAKIQTVYTISSFQGSGGVQLSNGSWTGVMGQLTTGEADMALFPLTLTAQRAEYIQHTQPYMDDGYGILVKTREVDSGYSFLLPFEKFTWIMFLVAMFTVMLLIALLDSCTRRARLSAFERTHGVTKGQKKRSRDKLMNHAIETVMMAVGSGAAPTSRSWAVKIVFVAWAIFCVIMLSAYTANLTAHMTVNQIGLPLKNLQDLAQMPAPFGVPAGSSVAAYFSNGTDKGARALRPKMVEYATTLEGAQAVRDGKIAAFINDYATVQWFTQEPPCNLALGSETVGSGALVIGLSPNSTLTNQLDTALLQLSEAGYMAELRRKWFVENSQCLQEDANADGNGRLRMSQAWSVFMVLAGGAGLAVLCALLEVMYYRRFFEGVHELKQDLSVLGPRAALKKRVSRQNSIKSVRFTEDYLVRDSRDLEETHSADYHSVGEVSSRDCYSKEMEAPATAAGVAAHSGSALQPMPGVNDSAGSGEYQQVRLTAQVLQQRSVQQQQQQRRTPFAAYSDLQSTRESDCERSIGDAASRGRHEKAASDCDESD